MSMPQDTEDTIVETDARTEPEPGPEAQAAQVVAPDGLDPVEEAPAEAPAEAPVDVTEESAEKGDVPALLEALLFASGKPVPVEKLAEVTGLPAERIEEGLTALQAALDAPGRGVRVDRVAGGVRLVSRPEFDYPIRRLLGLDGRTKLSMAALETLAIVAYRQPITAPEVAELRGVGSSSSIRTLLDRKLITTAGRKEVVGTPFLYKTTREFLVHFGLTDAGELPKLEELDALYGVEAPAGPSAEQRELFPTDDVELPAEAEASEAPASEPGPAPAEGVDAGVASAAAARSTEPTPRAPGGAGGGAPPPNAAAEAPNEARADAAPTPDRDREEG